MVWLESDWYFCYITEPRWFWKRLSINKVSNSYFIKSVQNYSSEQVFLKIRQTPSTEHFLHQTDKNSHRWCSIKIFSTHRKTPVLESLSNKVSGLKADNFIKKRLQLRYFPVSIAKFYRTHPLTIFVSLMK